MDAPSPFDRRRARAFTLSFAKDRDINKALTSAASATKRFDNAYADVAFGKRDPMDDKAMQAALAELATKVYGPLLQWRTQS
jgi:hypothetical protein